MLCCVVRADLEEGAVSENSVAIVCCLLDVPRRQQNLDGRILREVNMVSGVRLPCEPRRAPFRLDANARSSSRLKFR
jgi:hypothetical protein